MNFEDFRTPSIKERYTKLIADKLTISLEDLTDAEKAIINECYILFEEKMADLKIANDEIKRLTITLANYKAMYDDKRNRYISNDDDDDEDKHPLNYK